METSVARPPSVPRRLPYVGALDGLRAVSLLAVMAYHGTFERARGGFLGVSTFFTLSGFLITSLLLAELRTGGRLDLRRFWGNRARRLLPAAFITLVIVVAFARLAASSTQLTGLRQDLWACFGLVINWRLALSGRAYGGYTSSTSPVQHLWSLAIEEQFYLVLPLLIAAAGAAARRWGISVRRSLGGGALLLAVASTAFRWSSGAIDDQITWAYYATHTRAAELLVGVVLACSGHRLLRARHGTGMVQVLGVLGALVTLTFWVGVEQTSSFLYGPGLTLYSVASGLVIASCLVRSPVRTALDTGPLRAVGRISYGAYLYHWPIFAWLDADTVGVRGPALFTVQVGVTLGLAAASHRFVEMPIRRRELLPRVPGAARGALLVAALSLAFLVPHQVVDTGPSGVEVATGQRVAPVSVAGASTTAAPQDPASPTVERLLLVGDSIPQQLAPYVAGTLPEVEVRWIGGPGVGPLSDQGAMLGEVEAAVADFDPDVVVVHFAGSYLELQSGEAPYVLPDGTKVGDDSPEMFREWARQSQAIADAARSRGATVIWAQIPTIDPDNWFHYLAETEEQLNAGYLELSGVEHLDWWSLTGGGGPEGFSETMTDAQGSTERGRAEDGLHFTAFGNQILASTVADALTDWPGRSVPTG